MELKSGDLFYIRSFGGSKKTDANREEKMTKPQKEVNVELRMNRKKNVHKHSPVDKKPIVAASYSLSGIASLILVLLVFSIVTWSQ